MAITTRPTIGKTNLASPAGFMVPKNPFEYVETVTNLRYDPRAQDNAEIVAQAIADNPIWFDTGAWDNEDPIEMIRDSQYRLTSAGASALRTKEFTPEQKKAWNEFSTRFEAADLGSSEEAVNAIKDITIDSLVDPTIILGLGGRALAGGKVALSAAEKSAVAGQMQRLAIGESTKESLVKSAVAGGAYEGTINYLSQKGEVGTGLRQEVDEGEVALNASIGAGFGFGLQHLFNKFTRRAVDNIADETRIPGTQLVDSDPETAQAATDFANKAYTILGDGTIDLDASQFTTLDDAVAALTKQFGGGEKTKGELKKLVQATIRENQGATGLKVSRELQIKVGKFLHGYLPKYSLVGKPAGILSAYSKYSKTAAMLQKKFRYDLGRGIFDDRTVEEPDFFETFKYTSGPRLTAVKTGIDSLRGVMSKEEANTAIVQGLRGGEIDPKVSDVVNIIRTNLDDIAQDLIDYNIIDEAAKDYFPRLWDRKAIESRNEEFSKLLIDNEITYTNDKGKDVLISSREQALEFTELLLDINNQIDTGRRGSSFFSKRKINIEDDNIFESFLDNNIESVLNGYITQTSKSLSKAKVFGVQNEDEFIKIWIGDLKSPGITQEMAQAGRVLTADDKQQILDIYRSATGEGLGKYSNPIANFTEGYTVANRLALLPLATLSSLAEIGLNIVKAGTKTSLKSFVEAADIGFGTITTKAKNKLSKDFNLTEPEIWKEMNEVGLALDQAVAEGAERLSGEALTNDKFRKVNNTFFRWNLLDQWTKTVQMASFITGKNLIRKNLEDIAVNGIEKSKNQYDQLTELGIDVDEGLNWLNAGGSQQDVFYKKNIVRGAARYTNEVILNPSPEAGIKPAFMSDPKSSVFFQLLGYPAAFTNVVLKKMATDSIRDPIGNVPKIMAGALVMTHIGMFTNWARSHGESTKNKSWQEIYGDGVMRWGGAGITFDSVQRARKAAEVFQSPTAIATGPFGPVAGDIHNAILTRRIATVLGQKVPGYTALNFLGLEDTKEEYDDLLKEIDKTIVDVTVPERTKKATGGEVLDVPNVPTEPDERIDKMTGQPYDQQAGTAFVDAEDPLRRLGFGVGGAIARTIRQYAPKYVQDSNIQEASDFLQDQGIMDEPLTLSRIEAVIKGTTASEPEYIDDEIAPVLDAIGASQSAEDAFLEATSQFESVQRTDGEVDAGLIYGDRKRELDRLRASDDPSDRETLNMLNRLLVKMPRTRDPEIQEDVAIDREERLADFIKDSDVKEPVYRAVGHGVTSDYEINFALPREIAPHFGTKSQAEVITLRDYYDYRGDSLDSLFKSVETDDLFRTGVVKPARTPAMVKGYLNIKNPLFIDDDYGKWKASNFLVSKKEQEDFVNLLVKQTKIPEKQLRDSFYSLFTPALNKYRRLMDEPLRKGQSPVDSAFIADIYDYDLNVKLREYLKSLGFDGIKYTNKIESKEGEADFSYIPFDPQQFKVVTAARFDPEDPRAFRAEGGYV